MGATQKVRGRRCARLYSSRSIDRRVRRPLIAPHRLSRERDGTLKGRTPAPVVGGAAAVGCQPERIRVWCGCAAPLPAGRCRAALVASVSAFGGGPGLAVDRIDPVRPRPHMDVAVACKAAGRQAQLGVGR